MMSLTSIAWKVSPRQRAPARVAPKVGAMLAAAAIAIVGGAAVVVEADAVRAAVAVADTTVAAVAAEDGKASLVAGRWPKTKLKGRRDAALFVCDPRPMLCRVCYITSAWLLLTS